jgi:hypothetical protein
LRPAGVSERVRRIVSTDVWAWCCCAWILFIATRFSFRAFHSAGDFFVSVEDIWWFAGWLLVIPLLFSACAFVRPGRFLVGFFCSLSGVSVAMLAMSHSLAAFALASAILLLAMCAGNRLLLLLSQELNPEDRLPFPCGLPAGLILLALTTLGIGLLGFLTSAACWIIFALAAAWSLVAYRNVAPAVIRDFRRRFSKNVRECSVETAVLLILMGCLAMLNLVWATVPEIEYDALNYHLAVPKIYLEQHRVLEVPFFHAYFVHNIEMAITWILALGGSETVKFVVFGLGLAAAAATFSLTSPMFGSRAGLWAAALFYSTPLVGWESGAVYIDNIIALFVTCGLIAILRWLDAQRVASLTAAALLAGAAVGSKLNASFAFLPAGALIIWSTVRDMSGMFRRLAYPIGVFAITAVPCYALVWWYTGNPIFPFMNALFRSSKWALENKIMNSSEFGIGATAASLLRFPFRLTFDTRRFAENLPNAVLGIAIVAAFPMAGLMLAVGRKAERWLVSSVLIYFLLLFYTMQYARYVLPVLPVLGAFAAGLAVLLSNPRASAIIRISLLIAMVMQFPAFLATHSSFADRFPLTAAFGMEDRGHFLERALPGYSASQYLNRVSNRKDGVLTAGLENMRFYAKPQLRTPDLTLYTDPLRQTFQPMSPADLHQVLRNVGISRLLVWRDELGPNSSVRYPYLAPEFLARYTVMEFSDRFANVYRLLDH